ncbi:MAG: NAD(P)/FAD-dependent oxidoreductase [Candidatus Omnitrophota bacterium]
MIIIVGGGPAGMMAEISAASSENKVTLVEKNPSLGRKLLLTGGGRCNLTNKCGTEDLVDHFSKTGDFLRNAFKAFDNEDLVRFFAERGLNAKTEENGRVFPVTDKASSVLDVLRKELNGLKVKILLNKSIKEVLLGKDAVRGVSCADGSVIEAGKVVIAAGGLSYKATGSTGDGIKMAGKTGHRIVPVRPGLVSLDLAGNRPRALEGLSLNGVKLTFRSGKTKFVSDPGDLLFTRNGISGPVTLSSSARVVDWMGEGREVSVEIDIMPLVNAEGLSALLSRKLSSSPRKSLKNILREMVPVRLADILLDIAELHPEKKANQITAKERKQLAALLKGLRFDVSRSDSFEKAQVTRGGVSTKDIDPRTMESKKIKGLYFAGETIDVDGDCGGFNLQAAFSTGYLAGRSAGI